jgi:hypothetical protein
MAEQQLRFMPPLSGTLAYFSSSKSSSCLVWDGQVGQGSHTAVDPKGECGIG